MKSISWNSYSWIHENLYYFKIRWHPGGHLDQIHHCVIRKWAPKSHRDGGDPFFLPGPNFLAVKCREKYLGCCLGAKKRETTENLEYLWYTISDLEPLRSRIFMTRPDWHEHRLHGKNAVWLHRNGNSSWRERERHFWMLLPETAGPGLLSASCPSKYSWNIEKDAKIASPS